MSAPHGVLHQIANAAALERFAAAGPWPAQDAILLIEEAVAAWPGVAHRLSGIDGQVLAEDLALSGLPATAMVGLSIIADAKWPELLAQHRRVLSWT